jgi:CheY-like chemotaxis protein
VLVADDDPDILSLFKEELADMSEVELCTASSGYKAGFETARTRPRLLILDYNLGDIDAEQVLDTLTDDDVLADTRVVVMTGFLNDADIERLKSRGMTVWRKPLDFDLVRQEIAEAGVLTRF